VKITLNKKIRNSIIVASLFLVLTIPIIAETAVAKPDIDSKTVFLIKNHNQELKNQFGVRHNFDVGFTTFLNEHQVAGLVKAGFELESVPLYQLAPAPPKPCTPWPSCKNGGGDGDSGSSGGARIGEPSTRIPWGVDLMYENLSGNPVGGNGIKIAVLDTGADTSHPDLDITQCKDFTKGPKIKNSCTDDIGHGTHVIGTIAGTGADDNKGIFGVAPEATIYAYKVCGGSGCWTDDIAAAIDYAGSDHPRFPRADIVSMSLGGDSESILIRNAISRNSNILFIAAAGNDGDGLGTIDYPGANPNVMAVAAIHDNEAVADFSSRGIDNDNDFDIDERELEVGAPGVNVESTCTGSYDGAYFDLDEEINGYCTISGTSMATPHVSGLAAKLWQGDASLTRAHLQTIAKLHDLDVDGYDIASGYGLPQVQP